MFDLSEKNQQLISDPGARYVHRFLLDCTIPYTVLVHVRVHVRQTMTMGVLPSKIGMPRSPIPTIPYHTHTHTVRSGRLPRRLFSWTRANEAAGSNMNKY